MTVEFCPIVEADSTGAFCDTDHSTSSGARTVFQGPCSEKSLRLSWGARQRSARTTFNYSIGDTILVNIAAPSVASIKGIFVAVTDDSALEGYGEPERLFTLNPTYCSSDGAHCVASEAETPTAIWLDKIRDDTDPHGRARARVWDARAIVLPDVSISVTRTTSAQYDLRTFRLVSYADAPRNIFPPMSLFTMKVGVVVDVRDDSCPASNDGVCDDGSRGDGALAHCPSGTDETDCDGEGRILSISFSQTATTIGMESSASLSNLMSTTVERAGRSACRARSAARFRSHRTGSHCTLASRRASPTSSSRSSRAWTP